MKKVLLLLVCFYSAALYGAPVGNAAAPKTIQKSVYFSDYNLSSVHAGYEGDFVFDGRMQQQGGNRVDEYVQETNSGTLTLNFRERLDIFGILGSSYTSTDWRFADPLDQIFRMEISTQTDFLWAVGSRCILYEWGPACLGLGGRYSQSDYSLKKIAQNGVWFPTEGAQAHWRQWQCNLDLSYKIELFTPYIGIKYSNAQLDLNHFPTQIGAGNETSNQFTNKDPVGFYLGCTISSGQYFMINLEGRLIDEEAITVSADVRF